MGDLRYVRAVEVEVDDVIWDAQEHVVTKVTHLSVSTAIDTNRIGTGTFAQWLLENWQLVPITRK